MGFEFRSASSTHRGCVRPTNQDAVLDRSGSRLWAVADGVGGLSKGEIASAMIVERLAMAKGQLRESACRLLVETNREIFARNEPKGMAATAAVLGFEDRKFFCLWVGDCRVYLMRDGRHKLLTRDHRVIQELVDAGALDDIAARRHPGRNIVTRALGIEDTVAIDDVGGEARLGDVFVVVSDGVTTHLSDEEIAEATRMPSPQRSVATIVDLCLERGATDNLSVVVVEVGPEV